MSYFKKAKLDQKVYGLVFGRGKIIEVFTDSHYKVLVLFKNDYEVPYTEDGIPGWGNFKSQTLFYRDDVDMTKADFSPIEKILSIKKIIKHRENGNLEVRLPSGMWIKYAKAEADYAETLLEDEKLHLFRKIVKN
ncbi:MAG: hypothetical protein U9R50_05640 [Campylobacterota bacterium]|nr:hypothetical protein [Campylobacterota bacterium]